MNEDLWSTPRWRRIARYCRRVHRRRWNRALRRGERSHKARVESISRGYGISLAAARRWLASASTAETWVPPF